MTDKISHRLDPLKLPLFGERLIEASAGTGKTFTIGILYLRLLLGLGCENSAFSRPLTVAEILVVTFTEAATEELRWRIRNNIHEFRLACLRDNKHESFWSVLLNEINDISSTCTQLLLAEQQMDEAAIYTIHGFSHRILTHSAFECGMLFEQTLVVDDLAIYQRACADFWRRYCYQLPLVVARIVSQEWSGPEDLLHDLSSYLHREPPTLRQPPLDEETILMRHEQIVARIDSIKINWKKSVNDLEALIRNSGVNKHSYSSTHLSNWLRKVSEWSLTETLDYQLPKELNKFRESVLLEKTKHGEAPFHPLFIAIDELFSAPLTLRSLMMARALKEICRSIQQEKCQRAELGFDDLLSLMDSALQNLGGVELAKVIRQRYPVAMIDEFQDTDSRQYRIFHKIYVGQPYCGLLLIADPKQAIYSFRGADIFTYMRASSEVRAHYTLETNWRSSPEMVDSVNVLFCQLKKPFLFSQIPFVAVSAAKKNQGMVFKLYNKSQPAIKFWLQNGEGVCVGDYLQLMARLCATQIRDWISAGQQGQAYLNNGNQCRQVQASNITVLVRNHNEAALVRDALSALLISSVYLSTQDNIFNTSEAKDLLWVLQAVLAPEQKCTLRSAIATGLIGLDVSTLAHLVNDDSAWDALVDEFERYRMIWRDHGVCSMLSAIMKTRHLAENLLASVRGERRLTDLLHLSELLQEASIQFDNEHALVSWLAQQIIRPSYQVDNQQVRLESDRHLVQIITIHKSKGLQFDLVWLPFVSHFHQQRDALYHDRNSFEAILDLNVNQDSLAWAEEERLAEDLRLLYVALTRAVYHVSIGIAPIIQGVRKKNGVTDVHLSACGYLVQNGQAGNAAYLYESLHKLANRGIPLSLVGDLHEHPLPSEPTISVKLAAKDFTRNIQDFWRITSYTTLRHYGEHLTHNSLPQLDTNIVKEQVETRERVFTPHTFPRGAASGVFLHNVLEALDFTQPLNEKLLLKLLQQQGYADDWHPVLLAWINVLLTTPLYDNGVTLATLQPQHKQAELQFYLPISRLLHSNELNKLIKCYDQLSSRCPSLNFQPVQGILKGFIDLVFFWQGKYYLLDYKSNWLGEDSSAYTRLALERAIIEHRYDLQYQLYTLALHRYLRHRLPCYNYQHNFGGVIYLFLRGVDPMYPGNGIFTCYPAQELVEGMNLMFSKEPSL